MDSIFFLGERERASFIQHMMQSRGCTYICLWSYDPSSNCLRYTDGFYHQESSSSGNLSQMLFAEYTQSIIIVDDRFMPGLAFVSKNPYMVLQSTDLQRMTSSEAQRRFYQEAGIKNATFMGCDSGEIELGFSENSSHQAKEIMEMRAWISEYPYRQLMAPTTDNHNCRQQTSSSSSLRSLSYDSPELSPIPMLFDPATSYLNVPEHQQQQVMMPIGSGPDHQQVIRSLSHIRNVHLPSIESEEAAMTQAILAVISTSSATTSSSLQSLPVNSFHGSSSHGSAFRWYRPSSPSANLGPNQPSSRNKRQNMLKRSISFFSSLYSVRRQLMQNQGAGSGGRASSTQLHHMIAERRRREKINDSFQALRSLLPKGTKKDKASVLASTIEHMKFLINQLSELSTSNKSVEAQLILPHASEETSTTVGSSSSYERVKVRLSNVAASSSSSSSSTTIASRYADLQVTLRGGFNLGDMMISLLEFLKTDRRASVMFVEANTRAVDANATFVNNLILRLKIEDGDEWDGLSFQETIRRIVNDFAEKC